MNTQLLSFSRNSSRAASGLVIAVGLLVLLGWLLDALALRSIFPGFATMKANTAVAFVMAGMSLWQATRETKDQRIDQLLFRDELTPKDLNPGRMLPVTALVALSEWFSKVFYRPRHYTQGGSYE